MMRFEQMAENSPDAMIIADHTGAILYWNKSAERLLGYTVSESGALRIQDLLRNRHVEARTSAPGVEALAAQAQEVEMIDRDGVTRWIEISVSHWQEHGMPCYGAILRDISERRTKERTLRQLARHDELTGLLNRAAMRDHLEQSLQSGAVATLLVDLDGFKHVNDTVGHAAGDAVLRQAAARLRSSTRTGDIVARIGGDEFVVILPGCGDPAEAAVVAERIVADMEAPIPVQHRTVHIGASVGIALAPAQADTVDALLLCADLAVYKAKADGRHRQSLYSPALLSAVSERWRFAHEFHRAFENGEFVLHYQPQVRLKDGALVGAEALIRWQHPEHGLLQPAAFLPALLSSCHAVPVDDWVLRTACSQAAAWLQLTSPDFRMGVNASAVRLRSGEIAASASEALAATGLPPRNLELEITETVVLANGGACATALRDLRAQGVGIAFDDFGTGYASLSLLEDFPLTRLKIDRSFVAKMIHAPDVPVIRAILQLAKGFGLDVVAEGIETEDQLRRLRKKGCAEGQGYLFGPPMPAEQFEQSFIRATSLAMRRCRRAA